MAETAVKNEICRHCGADVRLNSQFCYHCGGALAADDADKITETKFEAVKQTTRLNTVEANGNSPLETPEKTETTLKSAASMRRQPKVYQPKKVKVVWEEYENAPNGRFIAAAIALALFAFALFALAIYLK